jgi:membrane-bound transcription factor site-1 protease
MLNLNVLEKEIILWPYTGHLSIEISVNENGNFFQGIIEGKIEFFDEKEFLFDIPLKVELIKTPLRRLRILFDQYHNIQYPIAYVPRDNLNHQKNILDWNGDHIHTNYRDMYHHLREKGYFIEILNQDLTQFDPKNYGTLLLMDLEEEYSVKERDKLYDDITKTGLSILVIGQWYNELMLKKIKFFDDNTHKVWHPLTGGANLPALNGLLSPYGISFGNRIYDGEIKIKEEKLNLYSSTSIIRFPKGGMIVQFELDDKTTNEKRKEKVAILGFAKIGMEGGRIAIFTDSNPFDSVNGGKNFWILDKIFEFTSKGVISEDFTHSDYKILKEEEFIAKNAELPQRLEDSQLPLYSLVKNDILHAIPLPVLNETEFFIGRKLAHDFNVRFPSGKIIIPSLFLFLGLTYFIYILTRNLVVRERRYSI